jgi:hypothetical protein
VSDDDGHAVSWQVLAKGTPVRAADGTEVGRVRRVLGTGREHLFDGIEVDLAGGGRRFVDAPEVARLAERAVTLTISAEEVDALPEPVSRLAQRFHMAPTVRRAKRFGRNLRDR